MILNKIFITFLFFCFFTSELLLSETRYSLVEINYEGEIEDYLLTKQIIVDEEDLLIKDENSIQVILNNAELTLLSEKNINYKVKISDLESYLENQLINSIISEKIYDDSNEFKLCSMSGYFTLSEIYNFFDNLSDKYPDLLSEKFEIGKSIENRPIFCYILGNKTNKNTPKILITSLHHSREPLCMMSLAYFVKDILTKYNGDNYDAQSILNNNLIYIVPVVNPDGYIYNQSRYPNGGGLWRKNRRMHNDTTFGVDINRNYGPYEYWNSPNFGSSTDSTVETYRGKEPFSEPETQAIKNLCESNDFEIALNLHSFGNLILYPNSALSKETNDSNLFKAIARHINSRNLFCFGRDLQTVGYLSRGTSDDWMYLENNRKGKILAFTAEIGTPADFFWPTPDKIIPYCRDNLQLYYEFLKNCYSNIVPVDYQGYSVNEGQSYLLNIMFQNIGLKKIENNCIISFEPLNNDIEIFNPVRNVINLNSSDIHNENFIIKRKKFSVAQLEKFKISIQNENYLYVDTLVFFIDKYDSLNLFNNGKLIGDWNMGEWGVEYIDDIKEFVLSDSPKGFYKNANENYLQQMTPITINSKNSILEFETKWSTEANRDACVVQISSDMGATWNYLKTQRMIEGDGAQKSKLIKGLYGLHGTFRDWIVQSVSLQDFYGQAVLFRFGLLSDLSKNFDGWYLKNIKLKFYQNTNNIDSFSGFENVLVYPNPLSSNDRFLMVETNMESEFSYRIFDSIGIEYFFHESYRNQGIISINADKLNSGLYFIELKSKNKLKVIKLLVLN